MGKPIPTHRRTAALEHCRAMGLTDPEDSWMCVGGVAEQLERDQPYEAMAAGMRYLDLTGTYRLMAVLLTAPDPEGEHSMPCDRRLKPRQTPQQRAEEIRKAQAAFEQGLINKRVKAIVSAQGAIAFSGVPDEMRDGVTDACIYRRIMTTGSALARAEIARAEQLAGRSVDRQVIGQGAHSHDGGRTWHNHK